MNANSSQTGSMAEYDAADTTAVIDGALMYGYQGGSDMFQASWANNKVSVNGDSMGTFVVSKNNKNNGTVTVNLNQQSPMNAKLTDLCNRNANFSIDIQSDTEHVSGAHCYVTKIPDVSDGDTASVRAWQIQVLNMLYERHDAS